MCGSAAPGSGSRAAVSANATLSSALRIGLRENQFLVYYQPQVDRHGRVSGVEALVLSAITVTAVLLLSFAPITFFFMLTTSGYQFFKLLNVFFFIIAGITGMLFLTRGMRTSSNSCFNRSSSA